MTDAKEQVINSVCMKMILDAENTKKLKNLLWMELHRYSLVEITDTELVVREETFNENALRMFIVAKSVQGCTKRTVAYYRATLLAFLHFLNDKPVHQITTNDIRYYLAIKKERDGNSDTNINNIRRVLSAFFGWLREEEYIEKNPISKIKKIRVEKRIKKPFKDIELEKLRYEASDDIRTTALLEVMLSTGCRIAEIEAMDREHLEGDEIVVYGKGKKERVVYLNAKARLALERYLKTRSDENAALFVSLEKPHNRLRASGIGIVIRNLGRACGVPDTHPHRFRRTAATLALNRGMPIDQVQLMLGHESIETTTLYAISAQESVKANHKKYVT